MTAPTRAASATPSPPTQPWTLYEAMRSAATSGGGALPAIDPARHAREPALDDDDAHGERRGAASHQPPVDAASRERGLDLVAENRRCERAGQHSDRGAGEQVPELQPHRAG